MGFNQAPAMPYSGQLVSAVINRWLRFDPLNKRGLVIKAGTIIRKQNGKLRIFAEDTAIDLTSQLGTAGADYFVYLNNDDSFSALSSKTGTGAYIGRFHTLCADAGSSLNMVMMCQGTTSVDLMVKGYRADEDPDFYALYHRTGTGTGGTAYNRITVTHPLQGFIAGDILPESVCCLTFRPGCLHEDAVVYDKDTDRFIDIYLQSGYAQNTKSVYNATHTVSREQINHLEDMRMVGKRLLTDWEFTSAAIGSNEKTNITGSSDKGTVGGHVDTSNRRMISAIGCEEMCGYLWQWLDEIAPVGGSGWNTYDRDNIFGQNYGTIPYALLAGGDWSNGASCGSRSRDSAAPRSSVAADVGGRGSSRVKRGWGD